MNETDVLDQLATRNPAPRRALSSEEARTRDSIYARMSVTQKEKPARRGATGRRRILITVAGLGLAAVIATVAVVVDTRSTPTVVALGSGSIPAAALETWTSVPSQLEPRSAVAENCAATLNAIPGIPDTPVVVLNSDLRGQVGSVILAQDQYTAWCVGTDGEPMYLLLEGPGFVPATVSADAIDLGPSGGRIPPHGYSFAAGHAGPDVARVTLNEDGIEVAANVENGWWTAWWPSDDETLLVDGTFTVETTDGTVTEYAARDIQLGE